MVFDFVPHDSPNVVQGEGSLLGVIQNHTSRLGELLGRPPVSYCSIQRPQRPGKRQTAITTDITQPPLVVRNDSI